MENEKFLPTGWHWKITPEQIEKIKERDRDTINKVYFDNLEQFKKMARGYCNRNGLYGFYEDCLNQIYVDLSDYDFTTSCELAFSIKNSFARACMSCKRVVLSLDKKLNDGVRVYGDTIVIEDTAERDFEDKESARHALELIAAQTHLSERNKDILTAYAFGCLAYRGLFEYARQVYSV